MHTNLKSRAITEVWDFESSTSKAINSFGDLEYWSPVLFLVDPNFCPNFPFPVWGEWYSVSNCTTSCSRVRQIPGNHKLYLEKGFKVESRNCTNERNDFNCRESTRDYARVNLDKDPSKLQNIRQNVECNQNICSGQSISVFLYSIHTFLKKLHWKDNANFRICYWKRRDLQMFISRLEW